MKARILSFVAVSMLIVVLAGCAEESPPVSERSEEFLSFPKEQNFSSANVSVYCDSNSLNCWVESKSDSPLQIQMVYLKKGESNCDQTAWIFTFQPGQIKKAGFYWDCAFFNIYDLEGKQKGFIYLKRAKEELG
jgi:predicted component of type VI protein secretion system